MFKTIVKRRRLRSRRARANRQPICSRRFALETLEPRLALNGTWTALAPSNPAAGPSGTQSLMLLSDGTVMVQQGQDTATNAWYKLSPNAAGSYVNGAWSPLAPMNLARAFFTTAVLPDGRVIAVGAEYYTPANLKFTNTAEMYDPVANSWTNLPSVPTPTPMGECPSAVLPDGRVLVSDKRGDTTYLYTPATNSWSAAPNKLRGDWTDEETWVKLPDNSVVSYDIWSSITDNTFHGQRYVPDSNGGAGQWVDASNVDPTNPPGLLSSASAGHEIGPAFLQADGNVIQFGALGNTAIYSPASDSWSAGPAEPSVMINGTSQQLTSDDDPGAMLPNGNILITFSPQDSSINSTYVYEYNPVAQTYTDVTPSGGINIRDWRLNMVMLPSGQVLMGSFDGGMQVYTPSGAAPSAAQPVITNLVSNGNGTYTLTGTQLNGISEGANFGDDYGVASNYPIVRFTDSQGRVFYGRTSNWSNTGVATGGTPVTTNFTSPAFMPYGTYSLSVIANGIASNPVPFTGGVVGPSADLAVTNSGPTSSSEGNNVTYSLTVTNNGPTNATNVVLKDTLGANFNYVAATKSQGTVSRSGSVVTFSLGSVAVGQTVTATVTAQATEDGNLTNAASATSSLSDANLLNNSAVATTAVAEPQVVVSGPITQTGKKENNVTVATFTHANGLEPASAFVATIDWGDGTTSTGTISLSRTLYSVKGSHTYASSGSHTITTTVVESESGSGTLMALAPGSSGTALAATVPQIPSMTMSTQQSPPTSRVAALAREQVFDAFAPQRNIGRAIRAAATDRIDRQDDANLADGAATLSVAFDAAFAGVSQLVVCPQ